MNGNQKRDTMTGIISDIHANWDALKAVFADGESRGVGDWICLGDIVGYGAEPEKCIQSVKEHCRVIVQGNHDEAATLETNPDDFNPVARQAILWTRYTLSPISREWLQGLPYTAREDNRLYVHASPHSPELWNYIFTESEARRQLAGLDATIHLCFIGHTHEPFRFVAPSGAEMINVGSVGQPRDGDPRASYVTLDATNGTTEFVRVEYDIESARQKILRAKLPPFLAERLLHGQ